MLSRESIASLGDRFLLTKLCIKIRVETRGCPSGAINRPNPPYLSVIPSQDHFFPEIFALHKQLFAYRKRSGYGVPAAASDLALKDPGRYKKNLHLYREKHFRI
jgi:hypothetical protein